ncbi:MAG: glycosyltransferase family 2 protein, partial [Lachnospiraceae bacterium]|nr:glycosyltransferase family 2 protein [Lachnospiraceae bacterium]
QGAAGAINNALKVCQGEFIVLYDVDDFLYPHSYSTMVNYLKDHPECGMVQCNGYFVTPSNLNDTSRLFVKDEGAHSKNYFEDYLFGKTHNWPSSYMLRAENLFDTLIDKDIYVSPYGQNLQVILPVAYKYKVGYIPEPLMRYLVRDNSVSHPKDFNTMVKLFSGFEENKVETLKRIVDMSENSKQKYITDAMVESYIMRLVYAFQKLEKKYYITEYKKYKKIAKPAFSFKVKNFLFHVPFMTSILKAIKK